MSTRLKANAIASAGAFVLGAITAVAGPAIPGGLVPSLVFTLVVVGVGLNYWAMRELSYRGALRAHLVTGLAVYCSAIGSSAASGGLAGVAFIFFASVGIAASIVFEAASPVDKSVDNEAQVREFTEV